MKRGSSIGAPHAVQIATGCDGQPTLPSLREALSSLLKKVFEVSRWATLIQDPSARRTKDSQPSGFGFEYCASHVRFRVFQQTVKGENPSIGGILSALGVVAPGAGVAGPGARWPRWLKGATSKSRRSPN